MRERALRVYVRACVIRRRRGGGIFALRMKTVVKPEVVAFIG